MLEDFLNLTTLSILVCYSVSPMWWTVAVLNPLAFDLLRTVDIFDQEFLNQDDMGM